MIQNLVFDLGNVLIRFDTGDLLARIVPDEAARPLLRREVFGSIEWVMLDRGSISHEDAIRAMSSRLPDGFEAYVREIVLNWQSNMEPIPGMAELVQEAKAAGLKLYLLSNVSTHFRTFQHEIEALAFFDDVYLSAEHLLLKPDPVIFRDAARYFAIQPEESVFIDDMAPNVESALRLGFRGVVFYGDTSRLRRELGGLGLKIRTEENS